MCAAKLRTGESYLSRRIPTSAQPCKSCGGTGEIGIFGLRGLGWFSSPCPACSSTAAAEPSGMCSGCTRRGLEQTVEYISVIAPISSLSSPAGSIPGDSEQRDVCEGDDRAHGLGIYFQTHSINNKDGSGSEDWPDGSRYIGQYRGGRKNGMGRFAWADGCTYNGEFVDNDIKGNGVLRWKDGCCYQGQWDANSMHGEGIFSWPDGRAYQGQYKNDERDGRGIFRWPDGSRWDGSWKAGRRHGFGTYMTSHGHCRQGEWREGRRFRWMPET